MLLCVCASGTQLPPRLPIHIQFLDGVEEAESDAPEEPREKGPMKRLASGKHALLIHMLYSGNFESPSCMDFQEFERIFQALHHHNKVDYFLTQEHQGRPLISYE